MRGDCKSISPSGLFGFLCFKAHPSRRESLAVRFSPTRRTVEPSRAARRRIWRAHPLTDCWVCDREKG